MKIPYLQTSIVTFLKSLFSFFGLVVGAATASWGAILASRKRLTVVLESPVRIEDKY